MPSSRRWLSPTLCLVILLTLTTGCATSRAGAPRDMEGLWKEYEQAVQAAKYPVPAHVSRDLVGILTYTPGLVWDQAGQKVLMAAWTKAAYYNNPNGQPYDMTLTHQTWLTAVPFLQRFCQKSGLQGPALTLRLAQRLGMPPNTDYDAFVLMWVDPEDFFRPCPDPEIIDHECVVDLTPKPVDQGSSCPWADALQEQVSGEFVDVTQAHLQWMCSNWTGSYLPDKPRESYPWTALGYTWDWGSKNPRGESEYVVPAGTAVTVQSVTPTDPYCARPTRRARATGS